MERHIKDTRKTDRQVYRQLIGRLSISIALPDNGLRPGGSLSPDLRATSQDSAQTRGRN